MHATPTRSMDPVTAIAAYQSGLGFRSRGEHTSRVTWESVLSPAINGDSHGP